MSSRSSWGFLPLVLAWLAFAPAPPARAAGASAAETSEKTPAAWLGVHPQAITPELRQSMDLPERGGVLVSQVIEGSPAAAAGFEAGDVILRIDGQATDDPAGLRELIASLPPGREVAVRFVRQGKTREAKVTLTERPPSEGMAKGAPAPPFERGMPGGHRMHGMGDMPHPLGADDHRPRLGVHVQKLNADLAGYFGVSEDDGVLVLEVSPDSPAAKAGLKSGDVIQKVDGAKVSSPDELVKAVSGVKEGDEVKLDLRHKGKSTTITARPERDDGEANHVSMTMRKMPAGSMPRGECTCGMRDRMLDARGPAERGTGELDELRREIRDLREEVRGIERQR